MAVIWQRFQVGVEIPEQKNPLTVLIPPRRDQPEIASFPKCVSRNPEVPGSVTHTESSLIWYFDNLDGNHTASLEDLHSSMFGSFLS
jgi:hypothetical protein